MKKHLLNFFSALLLTTGAFSQAVEQGDIIIETTYGFPNYLTYATRSAARQLNSQYTNSKVTTGGIGPIAVKFEYLIADKVGVGLTIGYANTWAKATEFYSNAPNTPAQEYWVKISAPRYRIMPKFNFHFGNATKFDAYTSLGIGYFNMEITQESNDNTINLNNINGDLVWNLPVAFRFAIGGRYFFTENIGIMMEMGFLGGGLLESGVSAKF